MQQRVTTVKPVQQVLESVLNRPMPVSSIFANIPDNTSQETISRRERIATLWLQLTDIYGSRFVNVYGEKDSGVWYQALSDLNEDDFVFGLTAILRDIRFETWPPNCTQFRHLCLKKASDNTIPSVHKAFAEMRSNLMFSSPRKWSHPAVKYTVKYLGIKKMSSGRTDAVFNEFSVLYEKVCERFRQGFQIPFVADEELVETPSKSHTIPLLSQLIRC